MSARTFIVTLIVIATLGLVEGYLLLVAMRNVVWTFATLRFDGESLQMLPMKVLLTYTILIGTPLFAFVSTLLFIKEWVRARRQRRRMKKRYLVVFILSTTLFLVLIAFILLAMYLITVGNASM